MIGNNNTKGLLYRMECTRVVASDFKVGVFPPHHQHPNHIFLRSDTGKEDSASLIWSTPVIVCIILYCGYKNNTLPASKVA